MLWVEDLGFLLGFRVQGSPDTRAFFGYDRGYNVGKKGALAIRIGFWGGKVYL